MDEENYDNHFGIVEDDEWLTDEEKIVKAANLAYADRMWSINIWGVTGVNPLQNDVSTGWDYSRGISLFMQ